MSRVHERNELIADFDIAVSLPVLIPDADEDAEQVVAGLALPGLLNHLLGEMIEATDCALEPRPRPKPAELVADDRQERDRRSHRALHVEQGVPQRLLSLVGGPEEHRQ